ncbi:reactive intermediate/imine deaminase [Kineosphaera limosa]|uniref:Putative ribonuclease n=1 Tax=Kineosphaera limosa NBRC 100340 TaxID=1184609 RepID=K6WAB4_9MICO|nr:RidA family protein [Kineosphaera limosa]NYE01919.1 reactive intermediate/imine deaminase [Kineosphaera limosa]GAB96145.1 putative ribonuclease [Kineosphaera limosa NBRC 100340]
MTKQPIYCDQAGKPGGPYTHAVRAGDLVFLAGAIPNRPDGSRVEGDFETQARATFDNLAVVAAAAGSSLADAVRVGVYLRSLEDFAEMNALYTEYFGAETTARTTLQADLPGFAIEVDAVLYAPLTED